MPSLPLVGPLVRMHLSKLNAASRLNNGRADKPVVITHQTISRLSSDNKSNVEPNYNKEEAKQTNSDEVPNDSEGVQQGSIKAIVKQLQRIYIV